MFELANSDTAIWFLPNNESITYFPAFADVDSLSVYGYASPAAYYADYAEYVKSMYEYYGYSFDYACFEGPIYVSKDELEAGHTYYFMARAYTSGTWNSDLFTTQFSAGVPTNAPAKMSKNEVRKQLKMKKAKKVSLNNEFNRARIAK